VARLHIPLAEMRLSFVNGRSQETDFRLHTGDEVGLFPPIAGGERAT
jgi:molybdopterin synthase sulfur carrier subunit